ncbi:MAG: NAD(P)H-hydrate dehydratase [Alphaproteobacteria bacterium]|nr:NAD(P)H-hydrate dehydratase [Alphaproteobacteria bacterium]
MTAEQGALALLTVEQMYRADALATAHGVSSDTLMENAGRAIESQILNRWAARPVTVLCGPGNNGGDGFVVARRLREAGWPVTLALLGERARLKGDAAANAARWEGEVVALGPAALDGAELVVDAIFGAGLARAPEGAARATIEAVNERGLACVGVDVPSGVHGDSGAVLGAAPRCRLTVTFFRRKPGHLLYPGRELAGEVVVADIGIPASVLEEIAPAIWANGPGLWLDAFPWPRHSDHKYTRGHALIAGGAEMTGAARLAARAAYRVGAGMVTIASPPDAVGLYASEMAGLLVSAVANAEEFVGLLKDARRNAVLVGPGCGVGLTTREMALAALTGERAAVLDADALTVFEEEPDVLCGALRGRRCVLTPHDGEFRRLFRHVGDRLMRARAAAADCGATVLLKGADSVIATPDGRAAINENAPPTLATAGAGDVLAGLVLGLLAQGMAPFEAACAATWLHGAAASAFGPGLIASDIAEKLPSVLGRLAVVERR